MGAQVGIYGNFGPGGVVVYSNGGDYYTPQMFGWSQSSSGLDQTAAIQAAIMATETINGRLYFPPGDYLLNGVGTELLLIRKAFHFVGASERGVTFWIDAAVGAGTDVFRIAPAAALQRWYLGNFYVKPVAGAPARNVIRYDCTAAQISYGKIEHVGNEQLGGVAHEVVNPTPLADGFFCNTFYKNFAIGGFKLTQAGDSLNFIENKICGVGIGIEADFYPGAQKCVMSRNNITSAGPAIRLRSGYRFTISDNNIEAIAGGNYPAQPLIDLLGDLTTLSEGNVVYNMLGANIVADTDAIHIDKATHPYIGPNTIYVAGSGIGVVTTVNTIAPKLDVSGASWAASVPSVTDLATLGVTSPIWGDRLGARYHDLADDAFVDLPNYVSAIILACCDVEAGIVLVSNAGAVTLLAGSANFAVADTDGKFCVFDNGATARVRNRLGYPAESRITILSNYY